MTKEKENQKFYVQLGTCLFRNILVVVTKKARPQSTVSFQSGGGKNNINSNKYRYFY